MISITSIDINTNSPTQFEQFIYKTRRLANNMIVPEVLFEKLMERQDIDRFIKLESKDQITHFNLFSLENKINIMKVLCNTEKELVLFSTLLKQCNIKENEFLGIFKQILQQRTLGFEGNSLPDEESMADFIAKTKKIIKYFYDEIKYRKKLNLIVIDHTEEAMNATDHSLELVHLMFFMNNKMFSNSDVIMLMEHLIKYMQDFTNNYTKSLSENELEHLKLIAIIWGNITMCWNYHNLKQELSMYFTMIEIGMFKQFDSKEFEALKTNMIGLMRLQVEAAKAREIV